MGINIFFSRNSGCPPQDLNPQPVPNAENYIIGSHKESNGNLLVEIKYPDCTNYEGNKILLYMNTTLNQLKNQKYIDPHFSEDSHFKSPTARFEPTRFGWELGMAMLRILKENQ